MATPRCQEEGWANLSKKEIAELFINLLAVIVETKKAYCKIKYENYKNIEFTDNKLTKDFHKDFKNFTID